MGIATPNPCLATLPEVVANGGLVPARLVDAFAARTVYASTIAGVVLDCVLDTGLTASGGVPTDNASRLNAVLAAASAHSPIHLVIDGGSALSTPLVIPATGHVTIEGLGWDTGFYMLSGSNASCIQNFARANLAEYLVWNPPTAQTVTGSNVTLRDFRINGNRGTYPDGNCNGDIDGTLTGYTPTSVNYRDQLPVTVSGSEHGPYTDSYFLSGIVLVGLDEILIDHVWVYDAPAYHVNLYHCTNATIDRCRIESPSRAANTDGIHINGGCQDIHVARTWFGTGDDAMAVNIAEGDAVAGGNITFTDCYLSNCLTMGRVYGQSIGATSFVTFRAIQGTCQTRGVQVGTEGGPDSTASEINALTRLIDCDVAITSTNFEFNSLAMISASAGVVELVGCVFKSPGRACPMVLVNLPFGQTIAAVRVADCSIHRDDAGNAGAYLLQASAAGITIKDFHVSDFRVTEQSGSTYADIPDLINITAGTIDHLTFDGCVNGVGTLVNVGSGATVGAITLKDLTHTSNAGSPVSNVIVAAGSTMPVSIGRLTATNLAGLASGTVSLGGPGVLASKLPVADALMDNGSLYLGSGHSNNPCIKLGGTAHAINYT